MFTDPSGPTRKSAAGTPPAETQPVPAARPPDVRPWILIALGAAAAAVILFIAAGTGYRSGLAAAEATRSGASASAATEQFDLGVQDLLAGRYDLARQRFEYVLTIDPGNADAAELLERAKAALFVPTSTPGPTPTPITPTPTLDVASLEGLFSQAQAAFAQEDWGRAVEASLLIRLRDPVFRRAEIDGLLAQALRARGTDGVNVERAFLADHSMHQRPLDRVRLPPSLRHRQERVAVADQRRTRADRLPSDGDGERKKR